MMDHSIDRRGCDDMRRRPAMPRGAWQAGAACLPKSNQLVAEDGLDIATGVVGGGMTGDAAIAKCKKIDPMPRL